MPRAKKYQFKDPQFAMFLHYFFLNVSHDNLKKFTPLELKKVTIGKNLRRWCSDADLEEQLMLLAKAGCPFEIRVGGKDNYKELESLSKDRNSVVEGMLKSKLFTLASAKMIQTSYYLHHASQSNAYMFNRNFQKIFHFWQIAGKNLGKWRKEDDLRDVQYGYNFLSEIVYKVLRNKSIHADLHLAHEVDIMILLLLHRKSRTVDNQNRYLGVNEIFLECGDGVKKKTTFSIRIKWLASNGYVIKHPKSQTYAIHDKGFSVIGEYLKQIAEFIRFDI